MQRAPRRHGRRRNRIGMRRHQDLRQPGAPLSATLSGLGSIGPRLPDSQEGSLSPGISVDSKLSGLEGSRRNRHRMDRSIDFELYWIESVHDGLEVLPKAHGLLQQDHQIEIALAMLLAACSRAEQHDSLQPVPQGCLESGSDLSANSLWKHPYTSKRHCRPVANRAPDLRYRWPPWRKPQRRRSSSSSKIGRRPGGGGTPRPWRKWSPRMPSSGRTAHPPCRGANPWPPAWPPSSRPTRSTRASSARRSSSPATWPSSAGWRSIRSSRATAPCRWRSASAPFPSSSAARTVSGGSLVG